MVASIAWRLRCNYLTIAPCPLRFQDLCFLFVFVTWRCVNCCQPCVIARRFNDAGLVFGWAFGSRFSLTAVLAIAAEAALGIAKMRLDAEILPSIAAMAFVLIVLPSFVLQLGIARRPPLAVNVIRALGPVSSLWRSSSTTVSYSPGDP